MADPAAGTASAAAIEIAPGRVEGRFDFQHLFGRDAPVEIEIGCGKGRFLMEEAARRPEVGFLGIEWSLKHLRIARDRAERRGLRNLRLYRADARHVLADLVPDASVGRVHVYCPDPWPKKRHHKRRLFVAETTRHLERVLVPGGFLRVSTDVRDYFEAIVAVVAAETALRTAEDPDVDGAPGGRTNYEVKYLAEGRAIHRAVWRRAPREA